MNAITQSIAFLGYDPDAPGYIRAPRGMSICGCGDWFEHQAGRANPVGCDRCKNTRKWKGARARQKARGYVQQRTTVYGPYTCAACEVEFTCDRKDNRYCSRECAFIDAPEWVKRRRTDIAAHHRRHLSLGYRLVPCVDCGTPGPRERCAADTRCAQNRYTRTSMRRDWETFIRGRVYACPICRIQFCPLLGNSGRTTCSDRCSALLARTHKTPNNRKRARKHGVLYEVVDRLKLFARDGWKCRACGCDTPIDLMGTNHDNAPEHDHVVPMSAGGPNTYANSQLLCRVCNWLKGASHWDDFVARWVKQ